MITRSGSVRLYITFLLVILFPLVQKQWLNLYLFDINNFTIYKLLYYLSGFIVPILVVINSLNFFTYYKFNYLKKKNITNISGKLLFFISSIVLILLSILISSYIFLNFKIILDLFLTANKHLVDFNIDKQILFILVIAILLIFRKTKLFIKKITLINFFIISSLIWYTQINSILLKDIIQINIFKFENINFLNIIFWFLLK